MQVQSEQAQKANTSGWPKPPFSLEAVYVDATRKPGANCSGFWAKAAWVTLTYGEKVKRNGEQLVHVTVILHEEYFYSGPPMFGRRNDARTGSRNERAEALILAMNYAKDRFPTRTLIVNEH